MLPPPSFSYRRKNIARRAILSLVLIGVMFLLASGMASAVTRYGTEGTDKLSGTAGEDRLWGYGGDDTIFGLGGDDYFSSGGLKGGTGDDHVRGGSGKD